MSESSSKKEYIRIANTYNIVKCLIQLTDSTQMFDSFVNRTFSGSAVMMILMYKIHIQDYNLDFLTAMHELLQFLDLNPS